MNSHEELVLRGKQAGIFGPLQGLRRTTYFLVSRYPTMTAGLVFLIFVVFVALTANLISPFDPATIDNFNRLAPFGREHFFGTDQFGRDLYARVVFGARVSLIVGFGVAGLTSLLGISIGIISGYNQRLDNVIMRFMDGLMALPGLLLAIALMAALGPSLKNVIIAIVVVDTPRMARLVRGMTLSLKQQTFVEAGISIGASPWRIMFRHIMPNALAPVIVQGTFVLASAILTEASLSFLGAGVPPSVPSWGSILAETQQFVLATPQMAIPAGLALSMTILAANLVGDGLREMLDPRMRGA